MTAHKSIDGLSSSRARSSGNSSHRSSPYANSSYSPQPLPPVDPLSPFGDTGFPSSRRSRPIRPTGPIQDFAPLDSTHPIAPNSSRTLAAKVSSAQGRSVNATPRRTSKRPARKSPQHSAHPSHAPRRPKTPTETTPPPEEFEPTPSPTLSRDEITAAFLEGNPTYDFDEETGELLAMKKSDKPTTNSAQDRKAQKAAEKSKKRKKRKIIIFSVLGVILALIIGGAVAFCIWGNDLLARLTGGKSDILDLFSETYDELQTDENGRINILAFGTSGFDMSGTDYDGSVHDGDELTDSIMVASINPDDGDLVLISIPRDFKVTPDCTAIGKINEVYWCNDMDGNNENAGAAALMTEVGEILGLDIPYYAHVNWGSLSSIIDAIGGINITLDEDIADYGYTDAVYQAGVTYTIDGAEAVGLARARHGTANGDFSRGASQQAILIGIKDKILGSNLSLGEIMGLANQLLLSDNLRTNFSIGEIKSLAHLGQTTDFTNIKGVNFYEPDRLMQPLDLPSGSYVVPTAGIGNFSEIQAYIAKVTSNDPRLQETETSILILNATGRPGVAGAEQTVLNADGYADTTVDDAPEDTYAPGYTLYALTSASPATTQFLESKYSTTAKKASALPEDLPSDYDFILIINN